MSDQLLDRFPGSRLGEGDGPLHLVRGFCIDGQKLCLGELALGFEAVCQVVDRAALAPFLRRRLGAEIGLGLGAGQRRAQPSPLPYISAMMALADTPRTRAWPCSR